MRSAIHLQLMLWAVGRSGRLQRMQPADDLHDDGAPVIHPQRQLPQRAAKGTSKLSSRDI